MQELFVKLNAIKPMSAALQNRLQLRLKRFEIKAGEHILRAGEICKQIFFIQSGMVKIYHEDSGKIVVDWILIEGDICVVVASFFAQIPSVQYLIALEDCVCFGITFDELEESFDLHPEFERHGRKIVIQYYVIADKREQALTGKRAYEKYEWLLTEHPNLLLRVSKLEMARFLKISESRLGQIKKQFKERQVAEAKRQTRRIKKG